MKCKLEDIVDVTMGQSPKSEYYNTEGKGYTFLQGNRTFGFKYPTFDTYTTVMTKSRLSILYDEILYSPFTKKRKWYCLWFGK